MASTSPSHHQPHNRRQALSLATQTGLALVVIVTGHTLGVILIIIRLRALPLLSLPLYGLRPCCIELFVIIAIGVIIVVIVIIIILVIIVMSYGPGLCCHHHTITGLVLVIIAVTGLALVVFIRTSSYEYALDPCYRCRCGLRPFRVARGRALVIAAVAGLALCRIVTDLAPVKVLS